MNSRKDEFKGYERIKSIGKGAFGMAVLYKRLIDNKNVVLKEIFLSDMSESEKQLAFNEARVLASLHHDNIIKYLGSFEKDGSLYIEMEYANNGNLAQLINLRKENNRIFKEIDITDIMMQITSAMAYMHSYKVLHRDLKTANIFLNKNGTIKIGDFGISKVMTTRVQAQTVVGTPYYLSPEMCDGKDYDEKSDVWALGCILYELTCFRKPFEATSLPSLVQKISTCEYDEIPDIYSTNLSQLLKNILQKDYTLRPSARDIHDVKLPEIKKYLILEKDDATQLKNGLVERSVLYDLSIFGDDIELQPIELPNKKIISFAASETHFIAVTIDKLVYTWGRDSFGQLGHGIPETRRQYPTKIQYLRKKNIVNCAAGNGFSIFLTENGVLYSCGDGSKGCLGRNSWNNVLRPTLIDCLIAINVTQIKCGASHVLALTSNNEVYSWGCSSHGQLGLGEKKFCNIPMLVNLPKECTIKKIFAYHYSSALIDVNGNLWLCGDNTCGKLGLNENKIVTFKKLIIGKKVISINIGLTHTMIITENYEIIGMGRNDEGQLGIGNCKQYNYPHTVQPLLNFNMVSCGSVCTVAGTDSNALYIWGKFYKKNNSTKYLEKVPDVTEKMETSEIILKPKCVLALYASHERLKHGHKIWLESVHVSRNSLKVLVNTTAPPPLKTPSAKNNVPGWIDTNTQFTQTTLPNTPQFT